MPVKRKSSDVQQNFGKVVEQALTQDDVIVERYGEPRVAILSYRRYQQLLQLEQGGAGVYLAPPQRSIAVKEAGQALAQPDEAVSFTAFRDELFTRPFACMRAVAVAGKA